MEGWGPTNGELMLEAAIREARIQMWIRRLVVVTCLLALVALIKYLVW